MLLKEKLKPIDTEQLKEGDKVYTYTTCREFIVTGFSWYALNCQIQFVHFKNVYDTDDKPAGTPWVLEMSMFLKLYGWFE